MDKNDVVVRCRKSEHQSLFTSLLLPRSQVTFLYFCFVLKVVQLYMSWGSTVRVPVPRWTLVGFDRQRIKVGATRTFTFTVTAEQMAVWTDRWQVQIGVIIVFHCFEIDLR